MSTNIGKIYYTPTSCGAASFIAACITGNKFESEQVDIQTHQTLESKQDYYKINPKGNVPTIVLPDGSRLDEGIACLSYIASTAPNSGLIPQYGTKPYFELLNHWNFVATELHKGGYFLLFNPKLSDDTKKLIMERLEKQLKLWDDHVKGKKFAVGNNLTILDIYASIVLSWSPYVKVDLEGKFPNAAAYAKGISELPQIKDARAKMPAKN